MMSSARVVNDHAGVCDGRSAVVRGREDSLSGISENLPSRARIGPGRSELKIESESRIVTRKISGSNMRVAAVPINAKKTLVFGLACLAGLSHQALFTAPDALADDAFGQSVSVDGNYMVIGAPTDDILIDINNYPGLGSAYIFEHSTGSWVFEFKLINTVSVAANDNFGYSVAINGTTIIVGAPNDDGVFSNEGKIFFFERDAGTWPEVTTYHSSSDGADYNFGNSVDFDGSFAIVGANLADDSGVNSGAAYIYTVDGEDTVLSIPAITANSRCGASVAIATPFAAVGCSHHTAFASQDGQVVVFYYNGLTWTADTLFTLGTPHASDLFGSSMAMTSIFLIVGAPSYDGSVTDQGNAIVYQYTGTWDLLGELSAPIPAASDEFGTSVAVHDNIFAVGAIGYGSGQRGAVFSYSTDGITITYGDQINHPSPTDTDQFGRSVDTDAIDVFVGTPLDDQAASNAGSLYVVSAVTCDVGEYVDGVSCVLCEPGKYQPDAGEHSCIDCGVGRYNTNTGSSAETDCTECLAGTYNDQAVAEFCSDCASGKYSDTNAAEVCTDCNFGTYNDQTGSDSASDCINCDAGKYNNKYGSTTELDCKDCQVGRYAANPGEGFCLLCTSGTYQSSTGQASCLDCDAGKFVTEREAIKCHDCFAGKYNTNTGSATPMDCVKCVTGKYSTTVGATSNAVCMDCGVGKYNPKPGANSAASCISCPSGNYNDQVGKAACVKCELGQYAASIGNEICMDCAAGKYGRQRGLKKCANCPTGKVAPDDGMSACTPCEAGKYMDMTGQQECTSCPSGFTSKVGASGSTACVCATGWSRYDGACYKKLAATSFWGAMSGCGPSGYLAQFSSKSSLTTVTNALCGTERCWVGGQRDMQMDLWLGGGPLDGEEIDSDLIEITAMEGHYYASYGSRGLRDVVGGTSLIAICKAETMT